MSRPPGGRGRRALVVAAAVVGTALAVLVPTASAGTTVHRAAIVVDTGTELKTARVTFTSDSITGLQALQLAGFSPEVRAFAGAGAALCKMCGKGCPTDGSCLTCSGATYWAYYRASAGATTWAYSPVGAGATTVRDGDLEGWRWGKGTPPPFVSFARIWGEHPAPTTAPPSTAPTPTPPTTAAVRASGGTAPPPSSGTSPTAPVATAPAGSGAEASTASTGPPAATPTTAGAKTRASTTSTASGPGPSAPPTTDGRAGTAVAAAPIGSGHGGGPSGSSWAGLVVFGVVAAGLLASTVVARRARRAGRVHDVAPPAP